MAKEIKAGVSLKLKDEFSKGIGKCAGASEDFAKKTIGALDKVNNALSGTAAKIGAFGVTLSLGAATREIINFNDRLTRVGLTANASAEQVGRLKQKIYDAARKYKISAGVITDASEVISTNTGDLRFLESNIDNVAAAIQAAGAGGADMGGIISQFNLVGKSAEDVTLLFDQFIRMGDTGSFTFQEFGKVAEKIMSAYGGHIGTSNEAMLDMYKSMLILKSGIGSTEVSASALEATLNELSSKQEDLKKFGITVTEKDAETGEIKLRKLSETMKDINAVSKKRGDAFWLNGVLGEQSMRAVRAFSMYAGDYDEKIANLGDSTGALGEKAAVMAGTLKNNLQSLQTAFVRFADGNLTKPLEKLTGFLNKLAEDPKRVEAVFNSIKRGLLIIGGIKIGAGVMSFLSSLRDLKGGNAEITERINLAGSAGAATPVFVTNWGGGGAAGGAPLSERSSGVGGLLDQYGNPIGATPAPSQPATPGWTPRGKWNLNKPNWKGAATAGIGAAAVTAAMAVPGMLTELDGIAKNAEMTKEEKSAAKGGAIGETVGSIGGAAAGALAGAAIGSVVPVVGTALGALVGGLIGQFGGPVGRLIGEKVGAAVGQEARDKAPGAAGYGVTPYGTIPASSLPPAVANYAPLAAATAGVRLDGQVGLGVNVTVRDDRVKVSTRFDPSRAPPWLNPGNAAYARGW
jgi:hypothetical protein